LRASPLAAEASSVRAGLAEGGAWCRSPAGEIYSFIVVHRPQHPAFFEDVPYNVVIVELEEGIRPALETRRVRERELRSGCRSRWCSTR